MFAMASASGKEEREPDLYVKQGNKVHSKMLSKEAAAQLAVPSFRVYYSVASAGAVPFLWESQPGTPKNDSPSAAALPPLTPPPSYYFVDSGGAGGQSKNKKRRPGLIGAILPRFSLLRRPGRTKPCSSCSSSSWSSSSSNTPSMSPVLTVESSPTVGGSRGHRRTFSAGDEDSEAAPRCFWIERKCCERGMVKGCCVAVAVRNALATVVGGKPSRRPATSATA